MWSKVAGSTLGKYPWYLPLKSPSVFSRANYRRCILRNSLTLVIGLSSEGSIQRVYNILLYSTSLVLLYQKSRQ